ncbi:hypothetical protein [Macellibacteroides fermentans]|jgi:hypothetical protein|uniref:hypothetical protein n=1 Tax=Macellibacteroides fermentans TaxID=879969 RepID=UPI00406CB562|nr:hypothetical protein [Bacteroides graminisolvens]NCC55955.1 hypothetical protein [Erysipelotrichia bacterium]
MKQKLFYLLLILPLSLLSCGNDDANPDDYHHPYGYMEGTFPDATLGRNLILVLNGDTLNNKNVQFVSKGSSEKPQAVLTLLNTINGEAKTEIVTDLVKATNPDNDELIRLKFEGIYSTKSHSVKYSGYIEPMVLSINLEE